MEKLDLAKVYKSYYTAPTKPQLIEFGPVWYVTIVGTGDPNGDVFAQATEALYTLSYSIKGIYKMEEKDFTVAKLEGLWWVDGDSRNALEVPKEQWCWKLMIRMPDYVTSEKVEEARVKALGKKKELDLLSSIVFESLHEGSCVQMLHMGPYASEHETLSQMYEFMETSHLSISGLHHEIYLSDPRKIDPSKMRTILRYPVKVAGVVKG
ncbi:MULTISPECIES: GyrI-like domain-containing protein [Paenibacillus]|uniref:GyrI-like domain-containing protein n=1 Tax=Paenibacillus violae TaxID=3077234 RepID=A0ABU3RPW1_9BACL|nr:MULTISPECIES: GyrI-like domain-containing protein [Paenibacillus]MDU0205887.1 GyrI-like domain-containing protein [Paenibacillus sp. PFR10]MEC0271349.1 GyrI-like domain-containing protein [Paenibacillus anseongense]